MVGPRLRGLAATYRIHSVNVVIRAGSLECVDCETGRAHSPCHRAFAPPSGRRAHRFPRARTASIQDAVDHCDCLAKLERLA
jgi:hypothetical protein